MTSQPSVLAEYQDKKQAPKKQTSTTGKEGQIAGFKHENQMVE